MQQYRRQALIALGMCPLLAWAEPVLVLQVVQRPPYLAIEADGQISGISVEPTRAAFQKAGVAVSWEPVPALRQLQRIKDNRERVCSVGWYKTKEREQFAKFSHAVSQDTPWVGAANAAFTPPKETTVQAILADRGITVLVKKGYVYGDYLDQEFIAMQARRMETNGDMPQVFQMIARGRAHITFAPREEIQYYLDRHLIRESDLKIIAFREMPAGYKRYLMCSKQVEDEVIARFNNALPHP